MIIILWAERSNKHRGTERERERETHFLLIITSFSSVFFLISFCVPFGNEIYMKICNYRSPGMYSIHIYPIVDTNNDMSCVWFFLCLSLSVIFACSIIIFIFNMPIHVYCTIYIYTLFGMCRIITEQC